MCLAVPVRIDSLENEMATCTVGEGGATLTCSTMLMDADVQPGDWIIVHAGFALRKLDPEEAHETLRIMREMVRLVEEQDKPEG